MYCFAADLCYKIEHFTASLNQVPLLGSVHSCRYAGFIIIIPWFKDKLQKRVFIYFYIVLDVVDVNVNEGLNKTRVFS